MTTGRGIGLLGGTFDPIHVGHLAAAAVAREALDLDHVLLLPSNLPPHRAQPLASMPHRFGMVTLAVDREDGVIASDLELTATGPSYTSATLRRLHALGYPASQLFFITGADAFSEIATWREYPSFLDDAHFVVVSRAGRDATSVRASLPALAWRMIEVAPGEHPPPVPGDGTRIFLLNRPTPDVSSTAIRARAARGEPLEGLVPEAVARHIRRHGLYRNAHPDPSLPAGHGPAASQLHEQEHR
jgi:nicotinate-nucleotide adenylyltransferase